MFCYTARERHSNANRSIPDRAILRLQGERIQAYQLRGYIFFGSVGPLLDRLKQSLDNTPGPACILLDFGAVSGFDFSAINGLCRFMHVAHTVGARVVLSAASEKLEDGLERNLPSAVLENLLFEPDADRALERCEDIVLATWASDPASGGGLDDTLLERVVGDMESHLDRQVVFEDMVDELRDWLEPREYDTGEALVSLGEPQKGMQLLIKGQASAFDSSGARLFQCGPGDAVEPRGAFGAHAAETTMIADQSCRTMMLTPAVRLWLEENEEQLIVKLYRYLLTIESRGHGHS